MFMGAYLPLLHYVSKQQGLIHSETTYYQFNAILPPDTKYEAREAFLADDLLRIQYLETYSATLSAEALQIISDLGKRKTGKFVIYKLLKDRAVWFDEEDNLYMVRELSDPLENMLPEVPCLVEATIFPFFNEILFDGFLRPYSIKFGPGLKKGYREKYLKAKDAGQIVRSM